MQEWFNNIDWNNWLNIGMQYCGRILLALLIFIIGRKLIKTLMKVVDRVLTRNGYDNVFVNFLENVASALLTVVLAVFALQQLGVQTTSLVAMLGAAGLAIGLALQGSLSNFASGLMILALKPFEEGDYVAVAGGVEGTVQTVRIFSTVLTTPDNRRIIVPNSMITTDTMTNFTTMDRRRIDLTIGVSYADDLKVARAVLEKIIQGHENILKEPEPVIMLAELADSSVNFAVRPWVKTEDYWSTRGDLLESIKLELEAAGCSIPYPQQDVHLIQEPAG